MNAVETLLPRRDPALGTLGREILAPIGLALLMLALIEWGLRSGPVLRFVDYYRPPYGTVPLRIHVEKQMWHLEALARRPLPPGGRVAIVGSSSVVNGVDVDVVSAALHAAGREVIADNLGLTSLAAYELPSLKQVILSPGTRMVVYLYNTFSFADRFHPDAVDVRWDTGEMLRLVPLTATEPSRARAYLDRFMTEHLWTLRFGGLLKLLAWRGIAGELAPEPYPWDYDPTNEPTPIYLRGTPAILAPPTDWLREAYLDSAALPDTIGYRGLRRFCDLAHTAGVDLVIEPIPEPLRYYGPYAQGIDRRSIDDKVRQISAECGARFVPRSVTQDIEAQEALFLDDVHMDRRGRDLYSAQLAGIILQH